MKNFVYDGKLMFLIVLIAVFCGSNQLTAMDEKRPAEKSKFIDESSSVGTKSIICPICTGPIRVADKAVSGPTLFECCDPRHVYHGRCVAKWLRTQGANATCPLCRAPLYTEMEDGTSSAEQSVPVMQPATHSESPLPQPNPVAVLSPAVSVPVQEPVAHAFPIPIYNIDLPVPVHITDISQIAHRYDLSDQELCLFMAGIQSIEGHVFEQMAQQWPGLRSINLGHNKLTVLPAEIGLLENLEELDLRSNNLNDLLILALVRLRKLKKLEVRYNPLVSQPNWPSIRAELQTSNPGIGIDPLPIHIIDISQIAHRFNPSDQKLFLFMAGIQSIEGHVFEQMAQQWPELRSISLRDNKLTVLPAEIGLLKNLQELEIDLNELKKLPDEIGNLNNLNILKVGCNNLEELSLHALAQLPLQKIAVYDNPLVRQPNWPTIRAQLEADHPGIGIIA